MKVLSSKNKIIIAFLAIALVALGTVVAFSLGNGEVIYGDWCNAPYWWVDEVTVVSIESGEVTLGNGNTYTEWWLNGDRYFRVSQAAARVLEIGETYEMKIMHGFEANEVTAIKKKGLSDHNELPRSRDCGVSENLSTMLC